MATAKITRDINGATVVTLVNGDWHNEYQRDPDGKAYRVIRAHGGALVRRDDVSVETWREVLGVAQELAAVENKIGRVLKAQAGIGRKR